MMEVLDPLVAALQAIDDLIPSTAPYDKRLVAAKCRGLMVGYHTRWINSPYTVLEVEVLVTSDLYNPETQRKSRSFKAAGKLDAILGLNGRRVVMDHKTTSEDIEDAGSPYWAQLRIEGQASHYMLLEWLNGRKAETAIWDVVRKPGISPRKLTKAESDTCVASGTYAGQDISDDVVVEALTTGRETLEMYQIRLAQDCTEERPQHYFQRRPVPRLDNDLAEYATELWDHSQDMLHVRRTERRPRNSGACMMYHSPCQFLGICSGYDTPDSDKWKKKTQVHVELSELTGDGRDVLTNSRIRMFQTCRRKEYYAYGLGIERNSDEEKEALFFGTVFHAALAAWLEAQKEEVVNVEVGNTDISAV